MGVGAWDRGRGTFGGGCREVGAGVPADSTEEGADEYTA